MLAVITPERRGDDEVYSGGQSSLHALYCCTGFVDNQDKRGPFGENVNKRFEVELYPRLDLCKHLQCSL